MDTRVRRPFDDMDMVRRVEKVIEFSGLSVRKFALTCGMNQSTLDRMLKGVTALNLTCVSAVLREFTDISAEWLMRGEGEMTKAEEGEDINGMMKLVDAIKTMQSVISEKDRLIEALAARCKGSK